MNLNQTTAQVEPSRIGQASSAPTPDNLATVLNQSLDGIADSLRYANQMIEHVGSPIADEKQAGCPQVGVMGRAFDLRSQIQRLNLKLEQLAALL